MVFFVLVLAVFWKDEAVDCVENTEGEEANEVVDEDVNGEELALTNSSTEVSAEDADKTNLITSLSNASSNPLDLSSADWEAELRSDYYNSVL